MKNVKVVTNEFVIDKDVPAPSDGIGRGGKKYPFDVMEVGDSFTGSLIKKDATRNAAVSYGKRNNKKFTLRKIDDQTFRIWRIQ